MTLSSTSLTKTCPSDALELARQSVQMICGTIIRRRQYPTHTRLLIRIANGEIYDTAYWPDNALVRQLDGYQENDIILCQVYFYPHPNYRCWKIWDLLEFDASSAQALHNHMLTIDFSARRLLAGMEALQLESSQCHELNGALVHTRQVRQQQINLMNVSGVALGGLGILLAPFTFGCSLSMLPGCAVLLSVRNDEAETPQEVQMRHRISAVTRRREDLQRLAMQTLHNAHAIETLVDSAKHQPWKRGAHADYRIFMPPSLRTVAAIAQPLVGTAQGRPRIMI